MYLYHLCLGGHVAHTEAVRAPAETAVRDQGHVLAHIYLSIYLSIYTYIQGIYICFTCASGAT